MYGDMAGLAFIEVTPIDNQGKTVPIRIIDIDKPWPHASGTQITFKGGGAPMTVSELPSVIYTAIDQKWTDWLNAFPA